MKNNNAFNTLYRMTWEQIHHTLFPVMDMVLPQRKSILFSAALVISTSAVHAGPTNGTVTSGSANIVQSGDATVTTAIGGTDTGNINVNSAIAWNANTLTLRADNDINATATAGLALEYAQTTTTGTYNVNAPINLASTRRFSTKKGVNKVDPNVKTIFSK